MLSINNITKKYNTHTVLQDINLEFQNGIYGLLAPNGAGKTTLMKILTTLSFPTNGEITWNGTNIFDLDEEYRDILGYLPQKFGYYKNYTPKQFLSYMATLKGLNHTDAEQRIISLMDKVALSDVMNKKMKRFSGGMLQRVGIAQSLLNNPKILVLDEPTVGLDPKERVRFRNMLREVCKDCIVILSTHIVSDVETIADKIIMLKNHKVICCESPEKICKDFLGKIYEVPVGTTVLYSHHILCERQCEQGTMLRLFCNDKNCTLKPVVPNLEDVFLAIYKDEG